MFENTDHFHFSSCNESNELIIVFSGAGAKSFNCFKLLNNYPINKLFIRDATRSWYQHPVKNHWDNIDEMIELIRLHTSHFDKRKITCMGGSMGGYAAMVTAIKINAGRALLFSPQTMLDHRLPNSPKDNIRLRYQNPFTLLAQRSDTEVKIYLGTEDFADLYNVAPSLRFKDVTLEFVYGGPHNLMNFLFQKNVLLELITGFLEDRDPRVLLPVFQLADNRDLYRRVCDFVEGFYFNDLDYDSLNALLDELQESCKSWPAIYHHRGKLHAKHGQHTKAVEQFEHAVSLNEVDDAIYSDLGLSAIQTKAYENAEFSFRKANELSQAPSPLYLSKIGSTLMLQGRYDDAIEMQHQALEINSKYATAYYQLGLIMNITECYSEAIPYFNKAIELGDRNPNARKHLATALERTEEQFV